MKNTSPHQWVLGSKGYTGSTSGLANDLVLEIMNDMHEANQKHISPQPLMFHGHNAFAEQAGGVCVKRDAFTFCRAAAVLERLVARMHHLKTEIRAHIVLTEVAK